MNPPPLSTPPPLPANQSTLFHQAGRAGLIAPIIAIVVGLIATSALRRTPNATASTVVAVTTLGLIAVGFLCALCALGGIKRHGRRGLLGSGLAGLVVNGLMLGLALMGFSAARQRQKSREAFEEMRSAAAELRERTQKNFNPETGITNVDLAGLDQLQSRMDRAARETTGDDASVAQAMSAHLARTRAASAKFQESVSELTAAAVLNSATLTNRDQIEVRRAVVSRFLEANEAFKKFIGSAEQLIGKDLERLGVPQRKVDAFMAGYRKANAETTLTVLKIRRTDDQLGNAMLGCLKVLGDAWGHWRRDADDDRVMFEGDEALKSYQGYVAEMEAASAEQLKLQQKAVTLQRQSGGASQR
jgi:hypothetical protein